MMTSTKFDPCVFHRHKDKGIDGVTVLQVDDSFGFGTKRFLKDESITATKYLSKERQVIHEGEKHDFNGLTIKRLQKRVFEIEQFDKLKNLKVPKDQTEFVSERAKVQYIGISTRPDLCAATQLLATAALDPKKEDYKKMKNIIERAKQTSSVGLKYVPLDQESLQLMLFTDASFANCANLKSQIGFILVLADKFGSANIIHYGSSRCRRVTRSVMAAEIHGLIYGFDNAYVVGEMLHEILEKKIPINGYVDSRTLFNVVAKSSATLEKRLQIDVHALREATENKELNTLSWIPGNENYADGLTKGIVSDNHPLWKLITSNKVQVNPSGWIQDYKDSTHQFKQKQKENC